MQGEVTDRDEHGMLLLLRFGLFCANAIGLGIAIRFGIGLRQQLYEPGFIAHVCLPDALARIVGGGQVKRFSLDFCGKNELHVPLVAVGSTELSAVGKKDELRQWWGMDKDKGIGQAQHWAVIVRNMFKEEQVGNPGLLQIVVREKVAV